MSDSIDFRNIEFGMAAAESERSEKPHLLLEAFMDSYHYIDQITSGSKFIVLGSKGSGKSAIASRIELLSEKDKSMFVNLNFLSNFPYNSFSGIFQKREAPETIYPDTWTFILILSFMNSFQRDSTISSNNRDEYANIQKVLKQLNLLTGSDLVEIVKKTSQRDLKFEIPELFHFEQTKTSETRPPNLSILFEHVRNCFYNLKGEKKHFIIIDGLDDVLTKRTKQYDSLAALILASDRLNQEIRKRNIPAKVVILSRTDLFERLPGPNKNKIRQDSAIELDWYQTIRDPENSNLVKLANLRAKLSIRREVNIFTECLPVMLYPDESTVKVMLNYTRHLPRDLIQLLNNIKKHCKYGNVTKDNILEGLRTYSTDYFVPEIKDELTGYFNNEDVDTMFDLISSLRNDQFSYSELSWAAKNNEKFESLDLNNILKALFDCSAIGNIATMRDGSTHLFFKYRNRQANINLNDTIKIHRALSKGLGCI